MIINCPGCGGMHPTRGRWPTACKSAIMAARTRAAAQELGDNPPNPRLRYPRTRLGRVPELGRLRMDKNDRKE